MCHPTGCPAVYLNEAKLPWEEKSPVALASEIPVYVQCEPKDNDEVAHQHLLSIFSISSESRMA